MKLANRTVSSALLVVTCLALIACSGVPGGNSGGGTGGERNRRLLLDWRNSFEPRWNGFNIT